MFKIKQSLVAALIVGVLGAFSAQVHATEPRVEHYVGMQVVVSAVSPFDALLPQKTRLAVELVFDQDNGQIVETVHRRVVGGEYLGSYVNTMSQIGSSSSFNASSPGFVGVVDYSGEDWNWDSWSYNLVSTDPSFPLPITGTGEYAAYGIHLNQSLVNPFTQEALVVLDTSLVHISASAYEAIVETLDH